MSSRVAAGLVLLIALPTTSLPALPAQGGNVGAQAQIDNLGIR